MAVMIWLITGARLLDIKHPTLPPTSIDGCSNSTLINETTTVSRGVYDDVSFTSMYSTVSDLRGFCWNERKTVYSAAHNNLKIAYNSINKYISKQIHVGRW